MPLNVFGKPITDSTLQEMPEYTGKETTATDRSRVAMKMIEADNKEADALTFVKNLKSTYGYGVTTLCLIYNATGGSLKHVCDKNWFGHIGDALYPYKIKNGQWGAFLHAMIPELPPDLLQLLCIAARTPTEQCVNGCCRGTIHGANGGIATRYVRVFKLLISLNFHVSYLVNFCKNLINY